MYHKEGETSLGYVAAVVVPKIEFHRLMTASMKTLHTRKKDQRVAAAAGPQHTHARVG